MTTYKTIVRNLFEILISPFILCSSFLLLKIRQRGVNNFKLTKRILFKIGVFPIIDHYYEPMFKTGELKKSLKSDRILPGIDFNVEEQISILNEFNYNDELLMLENNSSFKFDNTSFKSGDAEYYYSIIRKFKPRKIIEIGSGNSTLIALEAIKKNKYEDVNYECTMKCIEPYEMDWLELLEVEVIRNQVEEIDIEVFKELKDNDILFIDSSHIIRPQGDVLYEYLEILPVLNSNVLIHIHDIFTPKDYLEEWVIEKNYFWNEQYLLEAFLSFNNNFKIIGALNYLSHHYPDLFRKISPIFSRELQREPGSFWIKKN